MAAFMTTSQIAVLIIQILIFFHVICGLFWFAHTWFCLSIKIDKKWYADITVLSLSKKPIFQLFEDKNHSFFLNNKFLRERGMASNPKMEYQVFLCIFQKNSAMATLGLKEMGKFLWEGRKKGLPCWLSHFSKTKLRQPTGQTFFPKGIFPFTSNLR